MIDNEILAARRVVLTPENCPPEMPPMRGEGFLCGFIVLAVFFIAVLA